MNTHTRREFRPRKLLTRGGIILIAASTFTGIALAAPSDQVTVQASRMMKKEVGRSTSGIPIDEISLSVNVSTAGLDLASHAGYKEMEKRVHSAATSACSEIDRLYPLTETSNADCAATAARPALAAVREAREAALQAAR